MFSQSLYLENRFRHFMVAAALLWLEVQKAA